ncbi:hypothetical protein ENUP19_0057G0098 [Entamoeba nuttalli]|uniref:Uncharacterized protein n=2 Tax=Entamoeba nuttalli TaxID=412467 RepID=K2HC65_ENTNP|nr:hypothetical protein ENU1_095260 [Entamoeba nuttalli P19]EKE40299.1 hypothetical protein ENU1_095260 [Entamoeba nuttalli P19]|eukprot:XP_008857363.1 hypothetical protein ENU1_095260 [Entamoeba nuttalli P19]
MSRYNNFDEIDFRNVQLPEAINSQTTELLKPKKEISPNIQSVIQHKRDINTLAKQRGITEECQRMAFLIGLLNYRGVGFIIAKRPKKAEKALQYIEVVGLFGIIEVSHKQLLEIVQKEETEYSKLNSRSYNERYHRRNIFAVTYNYLLQLAINLYNGSLQFEVKKTKSTKVTIKMQKFITVTLKDKNYSTQEILILGDKAYKIISELMCLSSIQNNTSKVFKIEPKFIPFQQEMFSDSFNLVETPSKYWLYDEVVEYELSHHENSISSLSCHSIPSTLTTIQSTTPQLKKNNTKPCLVVPSSINKKHSHSLNLINGCKTVVLPISKK